LNDCICVCCNKLEWFLVRSERLIKPRDSLFSAKNVLALLITFINKVKQWSTKSYYCIIEVDQTMNILDIK